MASSTAFGTTRESASIRRALLLLCLVYATGMLCFQAFNYIYADIGQRIGTTPVLASMITALPGSLLGIYCFIYGSLGDFVSLRKMAAVGFALLFAGSVGGFLLNFDNVWLVVFWRAVQTAGGQIPGSVYLILCTRFLEGKDRVKFFGLFNAVYAFASIVGICCGGVLVSVGWTWLFLIPVVSVFCVPAIMAGVPEAGEGERQRVDVPGFLLFAVGVALLTFFFGDYNPVVLAGAAVCFAVFAVYIHRAENPFITPAFFKNSRWLCAISLLAVFYFYNHVIAPTYGAMGAAVYGMSASQVSLFLVPAYVTWTVVACNSGVIYARLGRKRCALLAAALLLTGFFSTAFCVAAGPAALTVLSCVIYGGFGLVYSPFFDTVVGTVDPDQSGRAVGMNDLAINVSASIGVAVFTPMMAASPDAPANLIGVSGAPAPYSTLFLAYGAIVLAGIVWYLLAYRRITTSHEPAPSELPLE